MRAPRMLAALLLVTGAHGQYLTTLLRLPDGRCIGAKSSAVVGAMPCSVPAAEWAILPGARGRESCLAVARGPLSGLCLILHPDEVDQLALEPCNPRRGRWTVVTPVDSPHDPRGRGPGAALWWRGPPPAYCVTEPLTRRRIGAKVRQPGSLLPRTSRSFPAHAAPRGLPTMSAVLTLCRSRPHAASPARSRSAACLPRAAARVW